MKRKVVVSYSGGKDCVLALDRALKNQMEVVALLTTKKKDREDSWFHNIEIEKIYEVSRKMGIFLKVIETDGKDYEEKFERGLKELRETCGIDGCIFGDIDIKHHREWGENRCLNVGIEAIFPLWEGNREELVNEFLDLGYKATIKKVDEKKLPKDFIGKKLNKELISKFKEYNIDVCGENGEYHTFVYDGPLFKK